jgi:hypothetical protein
MSIHIHTFVDRNTDWHAGNVTICGALFGCNTYSDGSTASLYESYQYNLTGVNLIQSGTVSQWVTSAGRLSNQGLFSITLNTNSNATATLFMIVAEGGTNWEGYVQGSWDRSPASLISSAAGDFTVPPVTPVPMGYWVGIGGFNSSDNLWQAGIENQGGTGNNWVPFFEAVGTPCIPYCLPQVNTSFGTMSPQDVIRVELTSGNYGLSSYFIQDLTTGKSWSGIIPYNATLDSAEWIGETPASKHAFIQATLFTDLQDNSSYPVLSSDFINVTFYAGYGTNLPLVWSKQNSWLQFQIEP